jgi:copper(I)-binding protein
MLKIPQIALACLMLTIQAVAAHEISAKSLQIVHPFVREAAGGSKVTAGYAKITNTGKEADRLIGASLKTAEKAELHATVIEDGVAKMRPQPDGIPIGPGATVELKPGSFHIMFLGLKSSPEPDQFVDGSLTFEKAGTVPIEFYVEPLPGGGESGGEHMHHHD